MPDLLYTGTLQINSNDPNSPREIGLQAIQSSFIVPVSYTSYEGIATIHGITELADVSDPPRKYQNQIPNHGAYCREEEIGGPASIANFSRVMNNRTSVNDADVKYQQMQIGYFNGGLGGEFTFPAYTTIPLGTPWWMGAGSSGSGGGYGRDSMDLDLASTFPLLGYVDGVSWFKLPFETGKRYKRLTAPTGWDRSVVEKSDSPVLFFTSRSIGSTTDSNGRFTIQITAERGSAGDDWNIYVKWGMGQYAIGTGPAATVYLQARRGNQQLTCDALTGHRLGSFAAGPGSGTVYFYRNFGLPSDTSFRLFGIVSGFPAQAYQFPQDWASEEARITDEVLAEAGNPTWFYLPRDVPAGTLLRNQTYQEVLVNEDVLTDALISEGGTVVSTDQWATTVGYSGGVDPESYDPIDFEGRTVLANFTMTGLTPLQVYTVKLTFEQVIIGGGLPGTLIEETIEVYPGLNDYADVEIEVRAPAGYQRRLYGTSVTGVVPEVIPDPTDAVNSLLWEAQAIKNGATYTPEETAAIGAFLDALATKSYKVSLKYVLPFVGSDIATQIQPIWDYDFRGPPTNHNFVDADGSTATGLRGNGSTKYLEMPFRNYTLQTQYDRSGQGVYFNQNNWGGSSGQFIGANWEAGNTQIFGLRIGDYRAYYYHGTTTYPAGNAGLGLNEPSENAHYYGVAYSDAERRIYKNGIRQDTNTNVVNSSGGNGSNCYLFGDQLGGTRFSASSLFVAYYTDGSAVWTDANVLDLHNLIQTHLIDGLGRSVATQNPDLATFKTRVALNSGTLTANSVIWGTDLTEALRGFSAYYKLRYTAAFLGADLNAVFVPIYDPALSGPMVNQGFVLGNFAEAGGLSGTGTQYLEVPRNLTELGSSSNGGFGFALQAWDGVRFDNGIRPTGGTDQRYVLTLNPAGGSFFSYGEVANRAIEGGTDAGLGNWYGQRSSATSRELFKNGNSLGSNSTNDTAASAANIDLRHFTQYSQSGPSTSAFINGTLGFLFHTNGELTGPELTELNTIIDDFLTLTGR